MMNLHVWTYTAFVALLKGAGHLASRLNVPSPAIKGDEQHHNAPRYWTQIGYRPSCIWNLYTTLPPNDPRLLIIAHIKYGTQLKEYLKGSRDVDGVDMNGESCTMVRSGSVRLAGDAAYVLLGR